jgi:DNA-binding CsgD family transcriptional regulator
MLLSENKEESVIEMARRRIAMIEVEEVLYRWLKGMSIKGISRSLGISRNTVKKLITQAQQGGLTRESQLEELEGVLSRTPDKSPLSF